VLVDLWAPWCGPCRMVAPVLERLAAEHAGRIKVVKVNVDEAPQIQARYGVQGIPTLVLLRGGEEVDRVVGAASDEMLRRHVDAVLAAAGPRSAHGLRHTRSFT
ncbi:MAG: thioredoxin, partial [Acidimicrobiia bacterium]